jgi:hypothetical protein
MDISFAEGVSPGYGSFLPYPGSKSTRWPLIRPITWSFEHFINNPKSIFETKEVLFLAVFDEKAVFAQGDAVGFNVTRGDSAASETSSWSFNTGMNCDGLLLRSSAVNAPVLCPPVVPVAKRFAVALTNDPLMVLAQRPYTAAGLEGEMRALKQWGLDRYHWIDNTGYEAMLPGYPSLRGGNYLRSRANCGELLPAACQAAQRQKLPIIADVKLFDLAWLGEPDKNQRGRQAIFDGAVFLPMPDLEGQVDAFMTPHPDWIRQAKFPITTLRLYSLDPIPALKAADIRLSQSTDNIHYRPVRGGKVKVVIREIWRPNRRWAPDGIQPDKGVSKCWMLEVTGFQITQPFVAFEAAKTDATLLNRQFAMVEAVSADGTEVPFIVGTAVHATIAGPEAVSEVKPRRFSFSAAMGGWLPRDEPAVTIRRWSLRQMGLAFVEPPTLMGLLEPAHPKAAQIWLNRIEFCLKSGVDGVSIRTLRHHNGCRSWTQYAYAPIVRARFEARYGRPVEPTEEDVARVREIRGEAFGEFLAEASRRVKARGKRFIFQMEVVGGALNAVNSRMGMAFNLEKWIADGLFDEIHVKINSGHLPWIRTVLLPHAKQHGVQVHLITANASAGYGHADYRIMERLVSDALALGYDGVNFYESANLYELTEGDTIQPRGMGRVCVSHAVELARQARARVPG